MWTCPQVDTASSPIGLPRQRSIWATRRQGLGMLGIVGGAANDALAGKAARINEHRSDELLGVQRELIDM
jgi:hypothetical protein